MEEGDEHGKIWNTAHSGSRITQYLKIDTVTDYSNRTPTLRWYTLRNEKNYEFPLSKGRTTVSWYDVQEEREE